MPITAEEFLNSIKQAPEDTGFRARSQMQIDVEQWKQVMQTIRVRGKKGVVLPFDMVKAQVASESSSLNNFVYQMNLRFKKLGINLHAGMRKIKNPKTNRIEEHVAISLFEWKQKIENEKNKEKTLPPQEAKPIRENNQKKN